jgi:hypothetical protein
LAALFFWYERSQNYKNVEQPGLPDGLFSNQKSQFGSILEGLGMEMFI